MLLRCVSHPVLEGWIPNQLAHALNWIPSPELNLLNHVFAIFVLVVPSDFKGFACPFWTLWETVNLFEERMFALGRWASTRLDLDQGSVL